jgi:uncharacterized protein involved in exopolysaccharide biosynthesis
LQKASLSGFDPLLKLIHVLVLRKRFILGITLTGTALAALIVMLVPQKFRADALIKPPGNESSDQMGLKSVLEEAGPISGMLGSFFGSGTGQNDCLNILGSVQFARQIIKKFELEKRYKFNERKNYKYADVVKVFNRNFSFAVTDEEAIRIGFEDKDPAKAAEVVEFAIHELDSMYTEIQKRSTNQKLAYFDERLGLAEKEMTTLEDSLVRFQNRNNLYMPEVQVPSTLESVVKMEAEMETLDQEMELESALRGKSTSRYDNLKIQRQVLDRDLRRKFAGHNDSSSLVFPVHSMAAMANEYFRLERAYKIKLTLYKFLVQQTEFLRLEAQKSMKAIAVLDPPWANDKRVSPLRRLVVEMVFALLLVLTSLAALVYHLWRMRLDQDPELARLAGSVRANLLKV